MKRFAPSLLFIVIPMMSMGQHPLKSFEYAMKKLTNKAWVYETCENGHCTIIDSDYYFFPPTLSTIGSRIVNGVPLLLHDCAYLKHYKYIDDVETQKIRFGEVLCNPIICFCDSAALINSYVIYSNTSGDPFVKGTLTMMSDSEFYYNPGYGHLRRFRSIIPPPQVRLVIPK